MRIPEDTIIKKVTDNNSVNEEKLKSFIKNVLKEGILTQSVCPSSKVKGKPCFSQYCEHLVASSGTSHETRISPDFSKSEGRVWHRRQL